MGFLKEISEAKQSPAKADELADKTLATSIGATAGAVIGIGLTTVAASIPAISLSPVVLSIIGATLGYRMVGDKIKRQTEDSDKSQE